jgi:hypothetical protein
VPGGPVLEFLGLMAGECVSAATPAIPAEVSRPVAIVAVLVVWLLVHCAVASARLVTRGHATKVLVPIFMLSRAHLTYLGESERARER